MTPGERDRSGGLIVGTAGHVDHGKTTLVRALTGVDTDRWEEEKERGLSIDLGFARVELEDGVTAGLVDVPGHEDFLKNMMAGATGTDLLLLAVAADEGPMPQTREHLDIATLLGVRRGVVALTKVDRVGEEWLELAREAVTEALRATPGVDGGTWPVVPVSAPEGRGVEAVRSALAREARRVEGRPSDDVFRLPVDRSFTLRGAGTVVTGTVWSGRVARDDTLRVLPGEREARVRSVEVHGREREVARAGNRCGLALVGVSVQEVARGTALVDDPHWEPCRSLGVRLRLLPHADRMVEEGQRVRVYLGTAEVMARVKLPGREALAPGETGWAVLRLEGELLARVGDRFVLRFYSPVRTLGGGRVAELDPPDPDGPRLRDWGRLLDGSARDAVGAVVAMSGRDGVDPDRLPILAGRRRDELPRDGPPDGAVSAGRRWFAEDVLRSLEADAVEALEELHRQDPRAPAASLQSVRSALGGAHPALVDRALDGLVEEGAVEVRGGEVRLPDHRPTLTDQDREARDRLLEIIGQGGAEPPWVEELAGEVGGDVDLLHDLLDLLHREGRLARISPDLYVTPEVEEELRASAARLVEASGPVPAGEFRDVLGDLSRDYLIAYLEHFDREGVTRRTDDGRVPAQST